jgi:hypothetical protein
MSLLIKNERWYSLRVLAQGKIVWCCFHGMCCNIIDVTYGKVIYETGRWQCVCGGVV